MTHPAYLDPRRSWAVFESQESALAHALDVLRATKHGVRLVRSPVPVGRHWVVAILDPARGDNSRWIAAEVPGEGTVRVPEALYESLGPYEALAYVLEGEGLGPGPISVGRVMARVGAHVAFDLHDRFTAHGDPIEDWPT